LKAPDHLNPTQDYGVAFERGTKVTINGEQQFFISGTASINKKGKVMYPGDITRQTARLLENIGTLLADGGAIMKDIKYFIVYLRDDADAETTENFMNQVYPDIPHILVHAKVCRPEWLIEMECVAEK
jgi:enamine deaminase RidA (YjgF/YER057c/UK114 family)